MRKEDLIEEMKELRLMLRTTLFFAIVFALLFILYYDKYTELYNAGIECYKYERMTNGPEVDPEKFQKLLDR